MTKPRASEPVTLTTSVPPREATARADADRALDEEAGRRAERTRERDRDDGHDSPSSGGIVSREPRGAQPGADDRDAGDAARDDVQRRERDVAVATEQHRLDAHRRERREAAEHADRGERPDPPGLDATASQRLEQHGEHERARDVDCERRDGKGAGPDRFGARDRVSSRRSSRTSHRDDEQLACTDPQVRRGSGTDQPLSAAIDEWFVRSSAESASRETISPIVSNPRRGSCP